jgi:hypothetical protein
MAAQEEKKIGFSAQDNGVSSFVKRLQQDTKQLFSEFAKEAEKQSKNQKEQLKLIEQQIAALERQNKLEREQNKLILERKRAAGQIGDKAYNKASAGMAEDLAVSRLQLNILKDLAQNLKDRSNKPGQPDEDEKPKESMFNAVLGASIFRDLVGLIRQVPNAKMDTDLISPFSSMVGGGIGAGVGLLAGYNAAAGATVGKELGGFIGDALTRHINENLTYEISAKRARSRTGLSRSVAYDMSSIGMDWSESANFEELFATSRGAAGSADDLLRMARAGKAYNLDRGMIAGYEGLVGRMGGSQGDSEGIAVNESRIITEALKRGIDQSALPDMFKSMTSLMTVMGSSRRGAADTDALQMILEFNKMGFDLRDPRTMGIMSQVHSGITNPSTAFGQALSYSILREKNPNASYLDLLIQRQQGGSDYLSSYMSRVSEMFGGNEELATSMVAKEFGLTGNYAAARDLVRGRGSINSLTGTELAGGNYEGIARLAEMMTPDMEQTQARITNAFIMGATDGIQEIAVRFKDRMTQMIDAMMDEQMAKLKRAIGINGKVPVKNGR